MKPHQLPPQSPFVVLTQNFGWPVPTVPVPPPPAPGPVQYEDWEIAGLKAFQRINGNPKSKLNLEDQARQAMMMAIMFPDALQREIQRLRLYCEKEGVPWTVQVVIDTIRKNGKRK